MAITVGIFEWYLLVPVLDAWHLYSVAAQVLLAVVLVGGLGFVKATVIEV